MPEYPAWKQAKEESMGPAPAPAMMQQQQSYNGRRSTVLSQPQVPIQNPIQNQVQTHNPNQYPQYGGGGQGYPNQGYGSYAPAMPVPQSPYGAPDGMYGGGPSPYQNHAHHMPNPELSRTGYGGGEVDEFGRSREQHSPSLNLQPAASWYYQG